MGLPFMLRPMPRGLAARGYVAERKAVPIDGPLGWFVPQTAAHFTTLGLNVPDFLWLCQESSGSLSPAIGSVSLAAQLGSELYGQTLTGWTRKFVGSTGITNSGFRSSSNAAFAVAAGESAAMIVLASAADSGFANQALTRFNRNAPTAGTNINTVTGKVVTTHGGVSTSNTPGVNHYGIDAVHMYGWYRRADIDASGTVSDLESVVGTHDELAIATPDVALGVAVSDPDARYCWAAVYKGINAEFDMGTYLATLRGG